MQKPARWPLVAQAANRGESFLKDARLVNAIAEKDPNTGEWQVQKRIGYTLGYTVAGANVGGGCYNWGPINTGKNLYSVFCSGLTSSLFIDGAVTGASSLDRINSGQKFNFVETQGQATRYLVFAGPFTVYYTSGAGWTAAPIPAHGAFIRGLAYLDSTIYFMDELCNIYGSSLDNPTIAWSATNRIIANKIAGDGIGLINLLQYVIALKSNSREVFYDAGNPTGSPLSPIDGALSNYGCVDQGSVQVIDNVLFYLSSNKTVSPQLVRVDNLVETVISTPSIDRLFDTAQQSLIPGGIISWTFKQGGHRFYGITVQNSNVTLVYDIDQNLWYQWTSSTGGFFPFVATGYGGSGTNHAIQGILDGSIYFFDGAYNTPTDNGVITPVDIYTPSTDFMTRRGKTLHRMYIRSDQTPGSILYIRRSNNDYKTWSNFRRLDLGKNNPYIDNEGTFIKRAYNFRHASQTDFRIRSADLQMDFGTI